MSGGNCNMRLYVQGRICQEFADSQFDEQFFVYKLLNKLFMSYGLH